MDLGPLLDERPPFFSPSPDSTDSVAFFSTSKLQISIVGPTKYNNITVQ